MDSRVMVFGGIEGWTEKISNFYAMLCHKYISRNLINCFNPKKTQKKKQHWFSRLYMANS
jgi:hypothetical protein